MARVGVAPPQYWFLSSCGYATDYPNGEWLRLKFADISVSAFKKKNQCFFLTVEPLRIATEEGTSVWLMEVFGMYFQPALQNTSKRKRWDHPSLFGCLSCLSSWYDMASPRTCKVEEHGCLRCFWPSQLQLSAERTGISPQNRPCLRGEPVSDTAISRQTHNTSDTASEALKGIALLSDWCSSSVSDGSKLSLGLSNGLGHRWNCRVTSQPVLPSCCAGFFERKEFAAAWELSFFHHFSQNTSKSIHISDFLSDFCLLGDRGFLVTVNSVAWEAHLVSSDLKQCWATGDVPPQILTECK